MQADQQTAGKVNILVVDDLPANLMALEGLLDEPDLNLVRASSGEEALKRLLEQDFALILLDVQMPGMDGFETAALIRERPRNQHTPIIFLTGIQKDPVYAARGYAVGAVDYMVKPLVPEALRAKVRVFADIYRQAEHARQETRQAGDPSLSQWLTLLEFLEQVLFSMDMTAEHLTQISPSCELIFGVSQQAFYKDPGLWERLIHPEDRDSWHALKWESAKGASASRKYRVVRPDGDLRWIQVTVNPTLDAAGRLVHLDGAVADVTSRVRTEEALRHQEEQFLHAQKLEALALLASGVIHDFNNLLTTILGHAELVSRRLPGSDANAPNMEDIVQAARQAQDLCQQFLAFTRKQRQPAQVLELNEVINGMERMLGSLMGRTITLELSLDTKAGAVQAEPSQLEQVLLNLVVNARDAMPRGGRLFIATAPAQVEAGMAPPRPGLQPGSYTSLTVRDTGQGIAAEIQDRIFDPFFTTKEPGKGTGLGLSTVYGIVKQLGGQIWVQSEPGQGTLFTIYLPRAETAPDPDLRAARAEAPGGTETILLVEDDDSVRLTLRQILQSFGYTVLDAAGGAEAVQSFGTHMGTVHLLLTDMVMPGMNGHELAQQLLQQSPALKVLYITGYADIGTIHNSLTEPNIAVLAKPFSPSFLARKVREALDE